MFDPRWKYNESAARRAACLDARVYGNELGRQNQQNPDKSITSIYKTSSKKSPYWSPFVAVQNHPNGHPKFKDEKQKQSHYHVRPVKQLIEVNQDVKDASYVAFYQCQKVDGVWYKGAIYDRQPTQKDCEDHYYYYQTEDRRVGPIWSNEDAKARAPGFIKGNHERWNGQWRTIVPCKMSVIGVDYLWK